MPTNRDSLLAGRNTAPLTDDDIRRAFNTFLGLDNQIPVRHEAGARTCCRSGVTEQGEVYAEIVFGADIYPGPGVADPNSSLSMQAAAAHELSHYHRWKDKTEIADGDLVEIDEALASLEAILRFPRHLNEHEVRQLVADAIQRLQMHGQRKLAQPQIEVPDPR
jgi:hypothetical protein